MKFQIKTEILDPKFQFWVWERMDLRDQDFRTSVPMSTISSFGWWVELEQVYASISTSEDWMRSGVARALRPRVWHKCALLFLLPSNPCLPRARAALSLLQKEILNIKTSEKHDYSCTPPLPSYWAGWVTVRCERPLFGKRILSQIRPKRVVVELNVLVRVRWWG